MGLVDLSTQRLVRQVEISVFIHATEDRAKVLRAVRNLFPRDAEFPSYTETNLEGYFGDPITPLYFLVKNRRPASELFNHIVQNLSSLDYVTMLDELPQRIDETKNLYLRFDKQKAFLGKPALERHDAIRVKVSLLVLHKADPVEELSEYMEEVRS
jgi:RNA binding exosome subunit